jgi:hypothetical protein
MTPWRTRPGRKVAGAGSFRDAVRSTRNKVVYAWVKQHAGAEHPQTWKDQGPARAVMLAFWLHAAIWCSYLASWDGTPTWRVRPWYTRKTTPSFQDALAALRRALWAQRIKTMSPGGGLPGEILGSLLDTLAEAA